jgi:4-hydroxy-3-methylbut-2-enyl diphosphate reductase
VTNFLPDKTPLSILMTSGASCPDTVVEATIKKIVSIYGLEAELEAVSAEWIS